MSAQFSVGNIWGKGVSPVKQEERKTPEALWAEGERIRRDLKLPYNPYRGMGNADIPKNKDGWPILRDAPR